MEGKAARWKLAGFAAGGLIAVGLGVWGHVSGEYTDTLGVLEWLFPAWGPSGPK